MEEFRGRSADELNALVAAYKRELMNLRFQRASGELANSARFKEVRRSVARAKTALKQLQSAAA